MKQANNSYGTRLSQKVDNLNLVLIVFLICIQRYDTIQIQPFYEVDISLYRLNRKAVFFILLIDNFTYFDLLILAGF
jgi:hypothetical protein